MTAPGSLTYAAPESALNYWEPTNSAVNALLIAALTTLLSYQFVTVIFNLLLGMKPRRKVRISDLHILMLVRNLSPVAVLANLFRSDVITRCHFSLPKGTPIERDEKKITFGVGFKLIVLLLIAPLANIVAVTLPLEHDTVVSIEDAEFGGLVLGLAENAHALPLVPLSESCELALVDLKRGEQPFSDFSICNFRGDLSDPERRGIATLTITRISSILVGFEVAINGFATYRGKQAFLRTGDQSFHIPVGIEQDALSRLMDKGMEMLAKKCGGEASQAEEITEQLRTKYNATTTTVLMAKLIACTVEPEGLKDVADVLSNHITFRESDKFQVFELKENGNGHVSKEDEIEFLDASSFPLFVRRRRNVSLILLGTCACLSVVLRILTSMFCHDDVDMGVDVLMKQALGLQCCDYGLREHGIAVDYSGADGPGTVNVYMSAT